MRTRHCIYVLLFLLLQTTDVFSQKTVKGYLRDAETGEAIPYASIYVSEETGTMTNIDGKFSLELPSDTTLVISCIGYERLKVHSSSLSERIMLKPIAHVMQEVSVVPVERILVQARKLLLKDYKKKGKKTSDFFYRQIFEYAERRELIEAFTNACSAVQLRNMSFLCGRREAIVGHRYRPVQLANTNIQQILELGPMIFQTKLWNQLIVPLPEAVDLTWFSKFYDCSIETVDRPEEGSMYCIHMNPKGSPEEDVLYGTLYVDKEKLRLLRFDGKIPFIPLDVSKGLWKDSTKVNVDFHVDYTHKNGFTEIADISATIQAGDLKCRSTLYNVDRIKKKHAKESKVSSDNMLKALDAVGFDSTMWAYGGIVQRTAEEEKLMQEIQVEKTSNSMKEGHPGPFQNVVERVEAFGNIIPQEKVYVHMDNTSYFLGDTIWFSAYTRTTTDDKPSKVSGVLYVELLNNDGYLVERKLIEMNSGHGHGFFALDKNIQYSGFYELRAYTRWQLNWGSFTRKHSIAARRWFINKFAEELYFRDYEKLYSRVFPVYDEPEEEGNFDREMTGRPMRRTFKKDPDERKLSVDIYPEGGNLVSGLPNRIAFEAAWNDGQYSEGWLHVGNDSAFTENRGRGTITLPADISQGTKAYFIDKEGRRVNVQLPKPEPSGIVLTLEETDKEWKVTAQVSEGLCPDSLAMTIMHEGRVEEFIRLSGKRSSFFLQESNYAIGIHQATVFDTQGHVYADRLFFVGQSRMNQPTLDIKASKEECQPYEKVELTLSSASHEENVLSLSVKDAEHGDNLYDDNNILSEMLLSSEIRGFVPHAGWFFQKDDAEHRKALDLLMLTQGWRRFNWRDMAVRGEWDITQKDERVPLVLGYITDAHSDGSFNQTASDEEDGIFNIQKEKDKKEDSLWKNESDTKNLPSNNDVLSWQVKLAKGKSVRLHTELLGMNGENPVVYETDTRNGYFRLQMPKYQGNKILFLSAADSAKCEGNPNYTWIQMMEDPEDLPESHRRRYVVEEPDYNVRIIFPYPRFVLPYHFYQNHIRAKQERESYYADPTDSDVHVLKEIPVKARKNRLSRFRDYNPTFMIDAYEAYNLGYDSGIGTAYHDIAQTFVGDMGLEEPYVVEAEGKKTDRISARFGLGPTLRSLPQYIDIPMDSIYHPRYLSSNNAKPLASGPPTFRGDLLGGMELTPELARDYDHISKIDRFFLYTDYSPRLAGSKRYEGSNLPETWLAVYPYYDGSKRVVYRDRRYIFPGFAEPADFYHPDYSQHKLPEGQQDCRRTLYWNPNLQLDEKGEAHISFYNNSRTTKIVVDAEGQAADGTLLWYK